MSEGGASDSDVVADTYGGGGPDGVSAGQSRFSAGRGKRLKLDDAPTSANTLSDQQARVVDLVMGGKNVRRPSRCQTTRRLTGSAAQVFFTGSAGVGKSWLIAHIIGLLRERYGEVRLFAAGARRPSCVSSLSRLFLAVVLLQARRCQPAQRCRPARRAESAAAASAAAFLLSCAPANESSPAGVWQQGCGNGCDGHRRNAHQRHNAAQLRRLRHSAKHVRLQQDEQHRRSCALARRGRPPD